MGRVPIRAGRPNHLHIAFARKKSTAFRPIRADHLRHGNAVFYIERDCVVTVDIGTYDIYKG